MKSIALNINIWIIFDSNITLIFELLGYVYNMNIGRTIKSGKGNMIEREQKLMSYKI